MRLIDPNHYTGAVRRLATDLRELQEDRLAEIPFASDDARAIVLEHGVPLHKLRAASKDGKIGAADARTLAGVEK